jgi:hypothetical protein
MIGFVGTSIIVILNYNQSQQLTINDCLRLAPFLTRLGVSSCFSLSSAITDFVLIYESVSSRCPLVNTPHLNTQSRVANIFTHELQTNYVSSFYT